ncbi:nicotinamidase 2 [Actinidia rufa]|uniref:Nicotinamidase 2 n=1 Tax=Actinidia rufa TaxID=165716 RepID=A0A7J0FNP7_9ERIC|nr:nicotinamidase 2 [Actinidia rufa]
MKNETQIPKTSILLGIDMQNYFSSMAKPILPALNTMIDLCHKSTADYGMLAEGGTATSPSMELMPELARRPHTAPVHGHEPGERLRELGAEEVIVCGVMTNLCCETTAREG